MTDDEIAKTVGEPPNVNLDAWQEEVLRLAHNRSLPAMLDDGQLDVLDYLAIAPILAGGRRSVEKDEYERRRLRHLAEIEIDWERIQREGA